MKLILTTQGAFYI